VVQTDNNLLCIYLSVNLKIISLSAWAESMTSSIMGIGESLDLSREDLCMAETSALLHCGVNDGC